MTYEALLIPFVTLDLYTLLEKKEDIIPVVKRLAETDMLDDLNVSHRLRHFNLKGAI